MRLEVFTPVFAGDASDETVLPRRYKHLADWLHRDHRRLKELCPEGVNIQAYGPGADIVIPDENDPGGVHVVFPKQHNASVLKGVVGRLHLLKTLTAAEQRGWSFHKTVFGCIDGSGAFDYDSLELLTEPFVADSNVEIVLGKRPSDFCGMPVGRKEIEEFEQYLLFLYRAKELQAALVGFDLDQGRLPDGQAGCWAFRLTAASRLPLIASTYLEYDVLASAIESNLVIQYTKPLRMTRKSRHSSASANPVQWAMGKLKFIQRKLRLTHREIAVGWKQFRRKFAGTEMLERIPKAYENALREHCGPVWVNA